MSQDARKYGELRWTESLGLVAKIIPFPAVLLWNVGVNSFAPYNRERSVKRIAGDAILRYFARFLSIPQLQNTFGTTIAIYTKWTSKAGLPSIVDETGEDGRLMWVGAKRLDRVVLFSPGGAFFLPVTDYQLEYCRYAQLELAKRNIHVGFAVLDYALKPTATFPTPLRQTALALEFLMSAGVQPQNLQLVSDSAGANLLIQLFSQMLHPLDNVPRIQLSQPIRGLCLFSPWAGLAAESESFTENDGYDYLSKAALGDWGRQVIADVPPASRAFADPVLAPPNWFAGVDKLVDRVLITAGTAECGRDDVVSVAETFKKFHPSTKFIVQENGLHGDLLLDFFFMDKQLGKLTAPSIDWLAGGFAST
ncbi:Alpha/Beta hydrolase protein [Mycena vitilis]|nr:Alpha/Beta hydrolase protein [Mycena vitilis]